jgi:hypothetical protein
MGLFLYRMLRSVNSSEGVLQIWLDPVFSQSFPSPLAEFCKKIQQVGLDPVFLQSFPSPFAGFCKKIQQVAFSQNFNKTLSTLLLRKPYLHYSFQLYKPVSRRDKDKRRKIAADKSKRRKKAYARGWRSL